MAKFGSISVTSDEALTGLAVLVLGGVAIWQGGKFMSDEANKNISNALKPVTDIWTSLTTPTMANPITDNKISLLESASLISQSLGQMQIGSDTYWNAWKSSAINPIGIAIGQNRDGSFIYA